MAQLGMGWLSLRWDGSVGDMVAYLIMGNNNLQPQQSFKISFYHNL
jgi:hypothetical protein